MQLNLWLRENRKRITDRWRARIRAREGRRGEDSDGFLGIFCETLVSFLPHCLGRDREEAEEAWDQASHLFGSFGLRRGLAAGEVVEDMELLREEILRLLMEAPPEDWSVRSFQLDVLALNQVLDAGVVRASVAYVDDLFFLHLQGSGVPEGPTTELEEEIRRQLESARRELESRRDGLP
jgi:hypothetical protein